MVNLRPPRWLSLTWFACVANKYDIATAKTKTTTTTPTTTTYNMRCRMLASRIRAAERARKFNLGAAGRAPARLRRFREAAEGDASPCARPKTSRRWDQRLDRAGDFFQKKNAAKRCPRLVLKKKSGCRKFSLMLETKSGCRAFCTRRTKAPWSVFNA